MMNADLTETSSGINTLIDDANSKLSTKTAENDPNRAAIIAFQLVSTVMLLSSSAFEGYSCSRRNCWN